MKNIFVEVLLKNNERKKNEILKKYAEKIIEKGIRKNV